jgi:hypothetical protein
VRPAGDNDVTVILKQQSGSRRWQHLASSASAGAGRQGGAAAPGDAGAPGRRSPTERNYTVILGSHRNSCLKFEKDGELCCQVTAPPRRPSPFPTRKAPGSVHAPGPACAGHSARPHLTHTHTHVHVHARMQASNVPGARVSNSCFVRYWINFERGAITVGTGDKGSWPWFRWADPEPIEDIRFVGKRGAGGGGGG